MAGFGIDSEPGHGVTFNFTTPELGKGVENKVIFDRPIEILLIEDSPGDARLTREALRASKIRNTLHVATDGPPAMDYLRQRGNHLAAVRPDITIFDLNLPPHD